MRGVYHSMHRIGFRRTLPLAFTLIHVVLVWFSVPPQPHAASNIFRESGYRSASHQEGIGVPTETMEPPPLKPVQKIAVIAELPAMFVAMLIGAVLFPRHETAWLYTSIPLVPLVWYSVGKWLDGLLGYCARVCLPQFLRGLLAIPATGVLSVSLAGLTPLYHHRTADTYWMFGGLVLWSGLCVAMVISSARRVGD
jgi:hypothetical protein